MFLNKQNAFLLKRKNQTLGLNEFHSNFYKQYIVAFKNDKLARKVHYNIHPEPILRLERSDLINITSEINSALLEMNIMGVDNDVFIDVFSSLYIPKMNHIGGVINPLNDGAFHLETLPLEDVYMMPFSKNIGVIFPYDIAFEDSKSIVLTSQVIDPVDSTYHFRKNIKL